MLKGLQTHFNARIDLETLHTVKDDLKFETVRVDAQTCSIDEMLLMIDDVQSVGLIPLVIINSEDKLNYLPEGVDVEWTNEPDGDISPSAYYPAFKSACDLAKALRINLWAPAISNLDEDSLGWLNDLRDEGNGWPEGLYGVSAHRYGDGTFHDPHQGFLSRESEAKWLKAACAGKPYIITEVGYPTADHITEYDQKDRLLKEFDFWEKEECQTLFIYQLNDGLNSDEKYGIRRTDGSWKPAAYLFVEDLESQGEDMADIATKGIGKEDLISVGENKYVAHYPYNEDTVLSIQPDGSWQTRPAGTAGSWEIAELKGDALKYRVAGMTYFVVVK